MNPLIQLRMIVLSFVGAFALGCFAFLPRAQALNPPPDGDYGNENTAEGDAALSSLTTGIGNTAIGTAALFYNTSGSLNTAIGWNALLFNQGGGNCKNTATGVNA